MTDFPEESIMMTQKELVNNLITYIKEDYFTDMVRESIEENTASNPYFFSVCEAFSQLSQQFDKMWSVLRDFNEAKEEAQSELEDLVEKQLGHF
jgi:hypothetical protein